MEVLHLDDVSFSFSDSRPALPVVSNISLQCSEGDITVFVGPSGSGKTTLLNLIAGLLKPTDGDIYISPMKSQALSAGYVFQSPALIPWLTIRQNALYGALITGMDNSDVKTQCDLLLNAYGLSEFVNQYPRAISGGMQQRVSIIRAALSGKKVMLLDEPFSNSDFIMRQALQSELSKLVYEKQLIAILVTHDIAEAAKVADKICILAPRPTYIVGEVIVDIAREERIEGLHGNEVGRYVAHIENSMRKQSSCSGSDNG